MRRAIFPEKRGTLLALQQIDARSARRTIPIPNSLSVAARLTVTHMVYKVEFRRPHKSQLLPVRITPAEDGRTYVHADDEQGVAQVAAESEHSSPSAAAVALAKDKKCSVSVVYK